MFKKLFVFILGLLSLTAFADENLEPKAGALQRCENDFESDPLLPDCQQGVQEGEMQIYDNLSCNAQPPTFHDFRQGYEYAMANCLALATVERQMACTDGLTSYAGLLAVSANYQTQDELNQTLSFDSNYYDSHVWSALYNELTDDQWIYVLQHRTLYPEYYPGYRLDQYYPADPENEGARYFLMPDRAVEAGVTVVDSDYDVFGPKSLPRPYEEGTPWYCENRPDHNCALGNGHGGGYHPVARHVGAVWGHGSHVVARGGFGSSMHSGSHGS